MGVTKRDPSGVFDLALSHPHAVVLDQAFQLSPRGITFITNSCWPEWTEVGIELRLPHAPAHKDQHIVCRGVVVQCLPREPEPGFEVTLLFLNLSKRAEAQLTAAPSSVSPLRIALSR